MMENEETENQSTAEDTNEGDKSESPTMYQQANSAAERLENANRETKELLDRQELLMAEQRLGGKSEAGQKVEVKDNPVDYMKKVMSGAI